MNEIKGHTQARNVLTHAASCFAQSDTVVQQKIALKDKYQAMLGDITHKLNTREIDSDVDLLDEEGNFSDAENVLLSEYLMMQEKQKALGRAIERINLEIFDAKNLRSKEADNYVTAYLNVVRPFIQQKTAKLLDDIEVVMSEVLGTVVGLEQAAKIYPLDTHPHSHIMDKSGSVTNQVIDKIKQILDRDWRELACERSGDDFPGRLPSAVVKAKEHTASPAQLARSKVDPKFKDSLVNGKVGERGTIQGVELAPSHPLNANNLRSQGII